MTDRELLERAASAAGIENALFYDGCDDRGWGAYAKTGKGQYWRPLDDDGDVLRLAIALDMALELDDHPRATTHFADESMWADLPFATREEKAAAIRRCIVRAAAALDMEQTT